MKKKPKWNQNSAIRGSIRRIFSRSPVVREVLMEGRREIPKFNKDGTRAKKNAVQYQCQACLEWISSTKVAVDHIEPVISVEDGFQDWNTFVDRLFCAKQNLQRICDTCHDKKTYSEKIARLLKQYTQELNEIEVNINIWDNKRNLMTGFPTATKKLLNKYIAKKKTPEFQQIVQRALDLKNRFGKWK